MWMRATLFSLGATSLFAFSPNAKGWYGASEIGPSVSYTTYRTSAYYNGDGWGESALLGLDFLQSVGWRNWATLDLKAAFATSLGALSYADTQDLVVPARLYTWDIGSTLYTSLAVERTETIFLEPAVGFSMLVANMREIEPYNAHMTQCSRLTYQGPSIGFYMRFFPLSSLGVRVGGMYMMARLRDVVSPEAHLGHESIVMKATARRHGLLAALRLDYQLRDWISLILGIEKQSWSSGGKYAKDSNYLYERASYFRRTRLSWGAEFKY